MRTLPTLLPGKETGSTMIIALVMLVLLTLLAISGLRLSESNLMIVGNMQARKAVEASAEYQLDSATRRIDTLVDNPDINILSLTNSPGSDASGTAIPSEFSALPVSPACVSVSRIDGRTINLAETLNAYNAALGEVPQSAERVEAARRARDIARACKSDENCRIITLHLSRTETDSVTGATTQLNQGFQIVSDITSCQIICGNQASCL